MGRARQKPISPARIAADALSKLEDIADPDTAARGLTFFKKGDVVSLYGVRAPAIRALARQIHNGVKQSWGAAEATNLCRTLAADPHHEAKMVGVLVLGRFHKLFPKTLLGEIRRWIERGWFPNWAAIDGLCSITPPLVRQYPDLLPRVTRWARSRHHWLRRASVVSLVPFARNGEYLDEAYETVASLQRDREDLMHKACGWLLREAGKTDMKRLESYLLTHGPAIPRTTVRYAIERFPEAQRQGLLVATRGVSR